jgi:fido (protein-threonine AMPylation protein)
MSVNSQLILKELNHLILLNQRFNSVEKWQIRQCDVYCEDETRVFHFAHYKKINQLLLKTLKLFVLSFQRAKSKSEVARSLSLFWLSFISIHPFRDGNGRTAKAYINEKLKLKSFHLNNLSVLDHFSYENLSKETLDAYTELFERLLHEK